MIKRHKIIFALLAIAVLGVGAYAAWYSYNRQAKIAQAETCNDQLLHPKPPVIVTAPDGSPARLETINTCITVVVPPPLFDLVRGHMTFEGVPERMIVNSYTLADMLLGRYTLGPNLVSPCNQSATTTDCAALVALHPPAPAETEPTTTTTTISSFTFEHPSNWYVTGLGWEQAAIPGAYNVSVPYDSGEAHVYIYTQPSFLGGINPAAKTLDDYRADYPISASSSRQILVKGKPTTVEVNPQVRILSSADVTISGVPMLKQRYSIGFWSLDFNGNRVFDVSDEPSVNDELRYVFFDGTSFAVITGWHADLYIDQIARSVHLTTK